MGGIRLMEYLKLIYSPLKGHTVYFIGRK
jgi:hypothetical protein